jgi:hypothetical protein
VLKKHLIAGTLAMACATGILAAQAPSSPAAQQPPAGGAAPTAPASPVAAPVQAPASTQAGSTTLTGCLYRENQIPGRTPNVAERAGVLEDYILADASSASPQAARPGATAGATGTSGSTPSAGNMYKVESIADDQLKTLVGKRVEVMGRIDPQGGTAAGGPTRDKSPSPDQVNLPEFEATSIKEVAGTCPATPAARNR